MNSSVYFCGIFNMKLSELIQQLFEDSEFTSPNSLANYTGQTQPFVSRFITGNTEAMEKMDAVFEALTPGLTADELTKAIALVKAARRDTSNIV